MIVIQPPPIHNVSRLGHAQEQFAIEAFIPQLAVEALYVGVLGRLARLNQQRRDAMFISPLIERPAVKLRSLIGTNRFRVTPKLRHTIQKLGNIITGQTVIMRSFAFPISFFVIS